MTYADPLRGTLRVTRAYGDTRTYVNGVLVSQTGSRHLGVDLAASCGTPVLAAGPGVVTFAGWDAEGGNMVKIAHGTGAESTLYGHLSALTVKDGWRVTTGQVIGTVGKTGNATGCHLHFGVQTSGGYVDPWPLLAQNAGTASGGYTPTGATPGSGSGCMYEVLGQAPSHVLTQADIDALEATYQARTGEGAAFHALVAPRLTRYLGWTWTAIMAVRPSLSDVTDGQALVCGGNVTGINEPADLAAAAVDSLAAAIAAVGQAIPGLIVNGAVLAAVVVLGYQGLSRILED
jgi:murein DD-endopeptidase MepM/ murein hydrolase activator NlpD